MLRKINTVIVMQLYNLAMEIILKYNFITSFDKLAEMMRMNRFESVFEYDQSYIVVTNTALAG